MTADVKRRRRKEHIIYKNKRKVCVRVCMHACTCMCAYLHVYVKVHVMYIFNQTLRTMEANVFKMCVMGAEEVTSDFKLSNHILFTFPEMTNRDK